MEGDAGTSRLTPTGQEPDTSDSSDARSEEAQEVRTAAEAKDGAEVQATAEDLAAHDVEDEDPGVDVERRRERFGRGWLVAICAGLMIVTAGLAVGGYSLFRAHSQNETVAKEDAMALERAKECVSATQAPDVAALTASQSKIIECSTGDFGVQANFFTGILVEAYQAANVAVQVSDLRGAVETHNDDGSVDVLMAVRVKVTNSQAADQEIGYRMRVNMAPADGTYKIAKLDQVTS